MIDLEFVERLIRALDESNLDNLELERGGTRIRLSKSPAVSYVQTANPGPGWAAGAAPVARSQENAPGPMGVAAVAEPAPAPGEGEEEEQGEAGNLIEVTSPMVGTFYRAPSPDAPPYVEVGDRVGKGTVLCIIEAMKLMNEMESEIEGTVAKILVENAQPVEYGQILFLIDPS